MREVGRSDIGLSGERTSLAWTRIGLSLVAVPSGLAAYSVGRTLVLTIVCAVLAAAVGIWLLLRSLRRPRTGRDIVERRVAVVDASRVVLAALSVLLIGMASLALVVERG